MEISVSSKYEYREILRIRFFWSIWKARQINATSNNRIAMNTRRAKVKRMKTR